MTDTKARLQEIGARCRVFHANGCSGPFMDVSLYLEDVEFLIEQLRAAQQDVARGKDNLSLAFVAGAKWWEWHKSNATMWQSDQNLAAEESLKRYPYLGIRERELEAENAELRREIMELKNKSV